MNKQKTYMNMVQPNFNYDEASDTLYISFVPSEQTTGIELTPHILLRLNKQDHKAVGITFLEYSVLAKKPICDLVVFHSQVYPTCLTIFKTLC